MTNTEYVVEVTEYDIICYLNEGEEKPGRWIVSEATLAKALQAMHVYEDIVPSDRLPQMNFRHLDAKRIIEAEGRKC